MRREMKRSESTASSHCVGFEARTHCRTISHTQYTHKRARHIHIHACTHGGQYTRTTTDTFIMKKCTPLHAFCVSFFLSFFENSVQLIVNWCNWTACHTNAVIPKQNRRRQSKRTSRHSFDRLYPWKGQWNFSFQHTQQTPHFNWWKKKYLNLFSTLICCVFLATREAK